MTPCETGTEYNGLLKEVMKEKKKWEHSLNFVKRSLNQEQFQLFPLGGVFV